MVVDESAVANLCSMGFARDGAALALEKNNGNADEAAMWLFSNADNINALVEEAAGERAKLEKAQQDAAVMLDQNKVQRERERERGETRLAHNNWAPIALGTAAHHIVVCCCCERPRGCGPNGCHHAITLLTAMICTHRRRRRRRRRRRPTPPTHTAAHAHTPAVARPPTRGAEASSTLLGL